MKTLQAQIDELLALKDALEAAISEERAITEKKVEDFEQLTIKIKDLVNLKESIEHEKDIAKKGQQEAFNTFLLSVATGEPTFSDMQAVATALGLSVPDEFAEPDEQEAATESGDFQQAS